jgi:membrane protease YdiL (CAAX protease family)
MNILRSMATNQPVILVLSLTIAWFVLAMVFMGIASSALHKSYGDSATVTIGRLAITACTLWLVWRLGWLKASGIARLGNWQVWLLALGGMIYFTCASLYAFYGKVVFDFSNLIRLPAARTTVLTQFVAGLSEEILFRGLVLYALTRVWGNTRIGLIGSVLLTSLLFAVLHITQVFSNGVSPASALLLTLETFIISIWWGALVILSGSIWPAVMLHVVVNAVVGMQGLTVHMIAPDILAYKRILWFSIPLGVLGIGLLVLAAPPPLKLEVPLYGTKT